MKSGPAGPPELPQPVMRRARRASFRGLALAQGQLLADPRRLAGAATQVIELGAAHVAAALHLDRRDHRRIGLERALHAFAAGDLAHREAGVEAAVALADDDAFVGLDALALAFDHRDVDDD